MAQLNYEGLMFKNPVLRVRGTIACPYDSYMKYGGNTSCVTVQCDDTLLIFDSGTGILPLEINSWKMVTNISVSLAYALGPHSGFPFLNQHILPTLVLIYIVAISKNTEALFLKFCHIK